MAGHTKRRELFSLCDILIRLLFTMYYNVSISSVFLIINYFILFAKLGVNELGLRFSFPRFHDLFSSSSSRVVVVVVLVLVLVLVLRAMLFWYGQRGGALRGDGFELAQAPLLRFELFA